MQGAKKWLLVSLSAIVLAGSLTMIDAISSRAVVAQEKGPGDHWRYFDGHWSYWHEGDKRWYYTDGSHWYYHDGVGWAVYQFDKLFGRVGFHPGEYHPPVAPVKVVPRHDVYRAR
ncbi:MAG TPA: hypothetical protein VHV08_06560 [Pirellulales bacterium]|nr:hypothetical protein [Pirellulales bacterium]